MKVEQAARAFALAIVVAGTSILAAPAQVVVPGPTTSQAGQMTQARVYIENRSRSEAVPVAIQEPMRVQINEPLRVQVINGDPAARVNPVMVAEIRKVWEYEAIVIPNGPPSAVAAALNAQGTNGWESTGVTMPAADGLTILMKRPR